MVFTQLLLVAGAWLAEISTATLLVSWASPIVSDEELNQQPMFVQLSASQTSGKQQGVSSIDEAVISEAGRTSEPLEASWFRNFDDGESNYNMDADGSGHRPESWEFKPDDTEAGKLKTVSWFHESSSGGSQEAWQTHYPAPTKAVVHPSSTGEWRVGQSDHWSQDPTPQQMSNGQAHAGWFDASVGNFDGFGRRAAPPLDSVRRLLAEGFHEKAVNTTLNCKTAGCTASALLQAYDPNTERAAECFLSLHLHPTDFDDQYSGERLTFVKINGVTVNTDCFPMISGCNKTTQAPLFPCVQGLPVHSLLDESGLLNISAQISDVVDECPYNGNLLSGVPMVTCLVSPLLNETEPEPVPPEPMLPRQLEEQVGALNVEAPLRCMYRGCTATALLKVDQKVASAISKCMLHVKVYQTDFDGDEGTVERLEVLKVNGLDVVGNMAPGKNPCRAAWKGAPLSLASLEHSVLTGHDVTANASRGEVTVQAKITDHVDECAHDGYLLDGLVQMNCTLSPSLKNNGTQNGTLSPSLKNNGTQNGGGEKANVTGGKEAKAANITNVGKEAKVNNVTNVGKEAKATNVTNVTRPLTLLRSSGANGFVAAASTRQNVLLEVPPAVGQPSAEQQLHYEGPMAHPTAGGFLTAALRRRAALYRTLPA